MPGHSIFPTGRAASSMRASSGLVLLAAFVVCSCHILDAGGNHLGHEHFQLEIIGTDGSGHMVLANPGSLGIPTVNGIIFNTVGSQLSMINYDGSGLRRFYPDMQWLSFSLSPDGSRILLSSFASIGDSLYTELYLSATDGTGLVKLPLPKGNYGMEKISPELDRIVFYRSGGLATIGVDGSGLKFITPTTGASYYNPRFFDENHILYCEDDSTDPDSVKLELYNTTTGEVRLLCESHVVVLSSGKIVSGPNLLVAEGLLINVLNVFSPSETTLGSGWGANFSTDGSQVVSYGDSTLYLMNSSGGDRHLLFTAARPARAITDAEFSPDGRYIVFCTEWTTY